MKKKHLGEMANISSNTLAKMSKNEAVSLEVLIRICKVFNCDIGDIMEIVDEQGDK